MSTDTYKDIEKLETELAELDKEAAELAAKIQENFEEVGV